MQPDQNYSTGVLMTTWAHGKQYMTSRAERAIKLMHRQMDSDFKWWPFI